jgi:hypothetical protein
MPDDNRHHAPTFESRGLTALCLNSSELVLRVIAVNGFFERFPRASL